MEKGKFIELIHRQAIQNGVGIPDDDKRITLNQTELAIDNLYSDMLSMVIKKSSDLDFFAKNYNSISILKDSAAKQYYSTLPISVIQLPNNAGIRLIRGQNSNHKFIPADNEKIDIYEDMDFNKYYDHTFFLMEGMTKVRYINFDYANLNIRYVNMKVIPTFLSYAWTDDIPLPSGKLTEFTNIVAKSLFQSKKFLDTSSDGVSQ